MKLLLRVPTTAALMAMLVSKYGSSTGAAHMPDVDTIVTTAPVYHPLAALQGEERFPKGAQLLLIHHGKAEQLVNNFAATADANVSFDGKAVLFAGKRAIGDSWQIWEFVLADHSVREMSGGAVDAIRPFYLPSGQFVYAVRTSAGFQLMRAGKAAGSAAAPIAADAASTQLQLSYFPASAIPADVLDDGRILFEANYPLGSGSTPELYLVYSDGSGVESYRCDHGRARWSGRQLTSGDVVFTHGTSLGRFTSPMAHEVAVVAPLGEYAGAIAEIGEGKWLASMRSAAGAHYALKLMQAAAPGATAATPQTVLALSGEDIVEPVPVVPRTRPHHHPTALHPWNYANLLALDSRLSREGNLQTAPASVRLETLDAQGRVVANGTAPVEADGSFFVQTPADRPIRFALLDAKGMVVREEHGWFWIRRGEQRICTGCHTGPERGSENQVPAVLLRTTVPVDLTGAKVVAQTQTVTPGGK